MNKMTRQLTQQFSVTKWFVGIMIGMMLTLSACATGPKLVDHAFEFDVRTDSPDIEILDYRYSTRTPADWMRKLGKTPQSDGINGFFPRGDDLFVKWKIKTTGEVFEQTVDLKNIDVTKQRINFVIEGPQLYVLLISRDPIRGYLPEEEVEKYRADANTPRKKALIGYMRHKVVQIYPAVQP